MAIVSLLNRKNIFYILIFHLPRICNAAMHSYIHTFNLYIYFFDFIEAAAMLMLQSRVIYLSRFLSFLLLLLQKKGGRFTDLHTVFFVTDHRHNAMSMLIFFMLTKPTGYINSICNYPWIKIIA